MIVTYLHQLRLVEQSFPVARPIAEEEQIGRDAAIEAVTSEVLGGRNLQVVGPRQIGKSSLAQAVERRVAARGVLTVYVDCSEFSSSDARLAGALAKGLAGSSRTIQAGGRIASLLGRQALEVAQLKVLADKLDRPPPTASEVLLLLAAPQLSEVRVVLVIDEAHKLCDFAGVVDALSLLLEDPAQRVTALIASSELSAQQQLLSQGKLRFKFSDFAMPPIERDDWLAELPAKLNRAGLRADAALVGDVVDFADRRPHHTMWLMREAARIAVKDECADVRRDHLEAAKVEAAKQRWWTQ